MIRLTLRLRQLGFVPGSETVFAWLRGTLVAALLAAVVMSLVIAIQLVPEWQVRRAGVQAMQRHSQPTPQEVVNLQDQMRKTFLQVVGGLFAITALYYTYRRVRVAEQGHITDRYTRAIEQLGALNAKGDPNIEVRLGAIYALERIAFDSPRDHWTVMEVLTAYVRQNAPWPAFGPSVDGSNAPIAGRPRTEIQAVLTVLGRRRRRTMREKHSLELSETDLRGANLRGAHLEGVRFLGANLEQADFRLAHVEGAYFTRASLKDAHFRWAHLEGAFLLRANARGARFVGAHLDGTDFSRALLSDTEFAYAHGLTAEQINLAAEVQGAHFDTEFMLKLDSSSQQIDSVGDSSSSSLESTHSAPEP